jgi:ketosteroid isomerase-like protein
MGLAVFIVAASLAQPQAPAPRDADIAELSRLETVWNDAHVRGDADALGRLWADDLLVTVPDMPVMTKADVLGFARSGRSRFQRYETSDVSIRVYGDAAVVTGRVRRTRTFKDRPVEDDWRFTKVYVRQGGAWRVVAYHSSPSAP